MLRLSLLGSFAVEIDGHALAHWPRKSALQLLQLLAISPEHRITRTQAAQALARDSGDEQLRQVSDALYSLRGQTAPGSAALKMGDYIGASTDAIWLDRSRCSVDIVDFEQTAGDAMNVDVALEQLEAVAAQCNGPLLADLSPVIETTVAPVRLHLEQLYLTCARALVTRHTHRGDNERVIHALRNVLRIVPSDEDCHRQLIELFATLGRYHEAEQQLSLCRTALARDLGLRPSAATIDSIRLARDRRLAASRPTERNDSDTPKNATAIHYSPPKSLVKLIGRDAVLKELVGLLTSSESPRLLTLCGIGGIGKTQLALELAHEFGQRRQHGAAVVDLTRIADATAVARMIAMTLGLKRTDGRSWQERLQQHVEPLDLLLVLDNFEHVHRAAPWLATLIEQSPTLTVVCTSRFPLLVRGEQVIDVCPLTIRRSPPQTDVLLAESSSDAASLFVRAARSQRYNAIDPMRDLPLIEEICWRLDGLPLAIELAAARACVVGLHALLTELATRHVALINPMQNAPSRHTSLRDLLESTCAVLDRNCKIGLSYVAHFEAGFTLAQFADSQLFESGDVERVLSQLLDARIVSLDSNRDESGKTPSGPRFRLLETMRSYARHSGWMDDTIQQQVTGAFVNAWHRFARSVAESRHTPCERNRFDDFEREFENVSGAIRIAARTHPREAREIVTALWMAAVRRGHIFDLIAWMEEDVLLHALTARTADEVNLLSAASEVYRAAAKYPLAQRYGEMAVRALPLAGADASAAHLAAAYAYLIQSELGTGTAHARTALTAAVANEDERGKLEAHILLTTLENRLGDFARARLHATTARDLCNKRGIEIPIRLIGNLALSLRLGGDFGGAIALYATAAERCRQEGESRANAIMTLDQAECELLALQLERARESLQRASALVATHRMTILECILHQQTGALHVLLNEPAQACAALEQSMRAMPAGSHFEQADITLLWLVHAHRMSGQLSCAVDAAVQLTSSETKVRRYIAPFVVETVAQLLLAAGSGEAVSLFLEAGAVRGADGLYASPGEKWLLDTAGIHEVITATQLRDETGGVAAVVASRDSLILRCHEALRALSSPARASELSPA